MNLIKRLMLNNKKIPIENVSILNIKRTSQFEGCLRWKNNKWTDFMFVIQYDNGLYYIPEMGKLYRLRINMFQNLITRDKIHIAKHFNIDENSLSDECELRSVTLIPHSSFHAITISWKGNSANFGIDSICGLDSNPIMNKIYNNIKNDKIISIRQLKYLENRYYRKYKINILPDAYQSKKIKRSRTKREKAEDFLSEMYGYSKFNL